MYRIKLENLDDIAKSDDFLAYIAGTIKYINDHIINEGIEIEILESRIATINNRIQETMEKIAYYESNKQPMYSYRNYTKAEIHQKVMKAAKVLDIEKLLGSATKAQMIGLTASMTLLPVIFYIVSFIIIKKKYIIDETLLYICIDGKREHISVDNARIKYAKNKESKKRR